MLKYKNIVSVKIKELRIFFSSELFLRNMLSDDSCSKMAVEVPT